MKIKEALIAWDCDSDRVKVDSLQLNWKTHWDHDFEMTGGGCYKQVQEIEGIELQHRVLSDFVGLVVRDGVDVQAAHREFMKIDEYRRAIPIDIAGAEES